MIIAIGFRVRSSEGIKFRIWDNKLKDYLEIMNIDIKELETSN